MLFSSETEMWVRGTLLLPTTVFKQFLSPVTLSKHRLTILLSGIKAKQNGSLLKNNNYESHTTRCSRVITPKMNLKSLHYYRVLTVITNVSTVPKFYYVGLLLTEYI